MRPALMNWCVAASLVTLAALACSSAASPAPTPAQPAPAATAEVATPTFTPAPPSSTATSIPAPMPTEAPAAPTPTATPPSGVVRRLTDEELKAELSNVRFSTRAWPKTDFRVHSVSLREFRGGGPGKDDIPPIDKPVFVPVAGADQWLEDREPVQVVSINGDGRAYPLQILIWHEIVNDVVGGEPVAVTY